MRKIERTLWTVKFLAVLFAVSSQSLAMAQHGEHAPAPHGEHGNAETGHTAPASPHAAAAHSAPHWEYEGASGPAHWAELSPDFAMCKTGTQQSPVDLKWRKPASEREIEFHYSAIPAKIIDNGHTIQVNFAPGNSVTIDGNTYELAQFHFHSQSEHTLSGKFFPLEMHLVHKTKDGKLAVVGVFFKEGKANPALASVWGAIPHEKGKEKELAEPLNPKDLLPRSKTHYNYIGSLTTPPCSEGVNWNVLNSPIEASTAQINEFRAIYSGNFRPIQSLHTRKPANY